MILRWRYKNIGKNISLLGQKFNRLIVIEKDEIKSNLKGRTYWICECDCGNIKSIDTTSLRNGNTKSCGCLQKEIASSNFKKFNTYDLTGEYGVGHTLNGKEFYFDLDDFDKIKDYCWYINKQGYVATNTYIGRQKGNVYMHRLIMNVLGKDKTFEIDHINHNKNNNKKSNLRIATRSNNGMNKGEIATNTSGRTGVSFSKRYNAWVAQICLNKKIIFLGKFTNIKDAIRTREKAEDVYFKEFKYNRNKDVKHG